MSLSGANINFYTPANEPYSYSTYLGINHIDAYFWITWMSNTRICGQFKTILQASGGGHSYWVEGKFSIPMIVF